jgi:hypothetical protein
METEQAKNFSTSPHKIYFFRLTIMLHEQKERQNRKKDRSEERKKDRRKERQLTIMLPLGGYYLRSANSTKVEAV